jgi:hypothetical protein
VRHTFNSRRYWARGSFPKWDHHVRVQQIPRCLCGDALRGTNPFCKACMDRLPSDLREAMLNPGNIDNAMAGLAACEQWLRMNRPSGLAPKGALQ